MSNAFVVPDDVKQFVEEIIAKNDLRPTAKIDYGPGADLGDGFMSKTYIVDVSDGDKSLHLFLKVPLGLSWHENLPITKLFKNEIYFYSTVYPAYQSFLREKGIENGFRNAPKCYTISGDYIALENLKRKGYSRFAKRKTMNDEHILLALKTFAKFHAVSYAFKDQRRDLYDSFTRGIQFCLNELMLAGGFDKMLDAILRQFLKTLDPIEDKDLLDASEDLPEVITHVLLNVENFADEYSTITQGDCWNNNMMYLYDQNNPDSVRDIMLVDWQLLRYGSPAVDLAYFFYPISSESTIEKYEYYMKVYHEELSKRIRQLGSDPEILYPFSVLMEEWKRFAKFGFAMSFFIIRGLLMEKDEVPNFEDYPEIYEKVVNAGEDLASVAPRIRQESLYQSNLKMILRHFVKHKFLQRDLLDARV